MQERIKKYNETKFDKLALTENKYFASVLSILSNSFVDLRYPESSDSVINIIWRLYYLFVNH